MNYVLHPALEYISESMLEVPADKILVKVSSWPHPVKEGDFIPCILNLAIS
jgi:hypothetical protein